MAFDLAGIIAGARSLVMEASTTAIWTDNDFTAAARLVLGEISAEKGTALTLKDLDAAAATTVPALLQTAFTAGTAAYAVMARNVDRAEQYELANEGEDLKAVGNRLLSQYNRLLTRGMAAARIKSLRAGAVPWGEWNDDFGERSDEEV